MKQHIIALAACAIALCSHPALADPDSSACLLNDAEASGRVAACTALLKITPPGELHYQMLFARGFAYLRLGSFMRSLRDLQEVEPLIPNNADLHFGIADAYSGLGYYALALPDIEEAMRLGMRSAAAYEVRGMAYMVVGRYGDALNDAEVAVTSDGNVSDGYFLRGFANLETGEIEHAIEDFDRAGQTGSNTALVYYMRGRAHLALDQYDAALADLVSAERQAPQYSTSEIQDRVRALRDGQSSPVPAPSQSGAVPSIPVARTHNCDGYYPFLSNALDEQGDVEVHYDVAADGTIGNVVIRKSSGFERLDRAADICIHKHWRSHPAMRDGVGVSSLDHAALIRFVGFRQDSPAELRRRGLAIAGFGDYGKAIGKFSLVIAAEPNSADAFFQRGFAELALQQYDEAMRDFTHAIKLDPKNDDAAVGRDMVRAATLANSPPSDRGI